ncbi:Hsp20/alpha crystallin family protein [Leptospira interrogans]
MGEGFMPMARALTGASMSPQLDIRMEGGKVQLEMDLPGVNPDDVDITLQDRMLTIKGERHEEHKEGEGDTQFRERRFGRFERRVQLPEGIDEDSLDARFEKGVLAISARLKKGLEQQRRIRIAGASEKSGRSSEQARRGSEKAMPTEKSEGQSGGTSARPR